MAARKKVIIEARINEYAMRDGNPNVPWTPEEIARDAAACRAAGASIVHFHARRDDGSPSHDVGTYACAIRAIRSRCDILVHPTLGQITVAGDEARIGPVAEMARDPATRPDFAPMDMGSTNIDTYDPVAKRFVTETKTYVNSVATLSFLAGRIRESGLKPLMIAWTVPFLRAVDAFIDAGLVAEPAMVCFTLTEGGIIGGHPGTVRGLEAFLDFLPANRRLEWSVLCKEGNLFPAAMASLERGGHVSIGLGDYAYRELGAPTNAQLVAEVVRMARSVGREPATPADVRAMLAMNAP
jgi:3-keto-5-aminohexanoate cleavage enzyme